MWKDKPPAHGLSILFSLTAHVFARRIYSAMSWGRAHLRHTFRGNTTVIWNSEFQILVPSRDRDVERRFDLAINLTVTATDVGCSWSGR